MFLDASVIVALLAVEPEANEIARVIEKQPVLATSTIAVLEALSRLAALNNRDFRIAQAIIDDWMVGSGVDVLPIDATVMRAAHACAARYHHLTGHPARLNMGDCFAYASARTQALTLAYKGDDFIHTDIHGIRFGG
ncbi:MAG: type II toxin-antitoxin system VapC family toxin [Bosea sp. (in: a-proteobacteria)]